MHKKRGLWPRFAVRSGLALQLGSHLGGEVDFLDLDALTHLVADEGRHFRASACNQLANGNVGILDEGLFDEAVLGQELLYPAADHLLNDLRRLAGLQRLRCVDLFLFLNQVFRHIGRRHHLRVDCGHVHGHVARQILITAGKLNQYSDAVVAVDVGAHHAGFCSYHLGTAHADVLTDFLYQCLTGLLQPARGELQLTLVEQRLALKRLLVASLGMMQVMMFAVGLYAGDFQGIDAEMQRFLRVVSLVVSTPVVFYSARPFFSGALRGLRARQPGMDVPVSIAVGAAYVASVYATFTRGPAVWFDSVTMFVFFLTLGRFLEMRARHRSIDRSAALSSLLPNTATRIDGDEHLIVPVSQL